MAGTSFPGCCLRSSDIEVAAPRRVIRKFDDMPDPVNLNQFRKQKAQAEKKARADANAVKFGRSKAEKQLDRSLRDKQARDLDGHKADDQSET